MNNLLLVSVVVPTHNSGATLQACLESIVRQTYQHIELVVVDNGSTDATVEIAHAFTLIVQNAGPERSAQRNTGARYAQGQYLLFIDSDMVLEAAVIEQCIQLARTDSDVKGVIIPERSVGEGFWTQCKALERSCYIGDDSIEAARFFDRTAFEEVGGYDESLTGPEDWDLSQRIARLGRLRRTGAFINHLEGRLTLRETMHSKFYYGKTFAHYMRKQPRDATQQFRLLRPAFVRHWRRLLAQPLLTIGLVILKTCEYGAGGAGAASTAMTHYRRRFMRTTRRGY